MSENTSNTKLVATPGQTIGPFYGYALPFEKGEQLVHPAHPKAVRLHGVVTDGHGEVVPDALLEIWQADENGAVPTADGSLVRDGYTFTTVDPGPTEPGKAPFITLTVFARGLLNRLFTRIYLPEDTEALANDPLLSSLPEDRRRTLVAEREADGSLRFDIRLQGEDETVFLTYPNLEK